MIAERSARRGRRSPRALPKARAQAKRLRVLIVDDSLFARAQLRDMLNAAGADVVGEADSAEQGVALFSVLRPDVVTMDMNMPGLTGVDAILALRELDPRCRVVLITAVHVDPIVAGLFAMGVPILQKPVDEAELRALIGSDRPR